MLSESQLKKLTYVAMQLLNQCYSRKERATTKCSCDHRYKKSLSPQFMQAVKDALFCIYFVRPGEKKTTGDCTGWPLTAAVCSSTMHLYSFKFCYSIQVSCTKINTSAIQITEEIFCLSAPKLTICCPI